MNHLEKWTTNESLLQSYRQIFIGSQSFFLAVGAILINSAPDWLVISLAAIGLFMIWYVWFLVVRVRHLVVDYHKYIFLKAIELEEKCTENQYIKNRKLRKEANKQLDIRTNWRPTRIKVDIILPVAYSLTWVMLVCYKLFT